MSHSSGVLSEDAQLVRALIELVPETLLVIDREGVILAINEQGAQRLGRSVEELLGHCAYDFFPPALAEGRRRVAEQIKATREPVYIEDVRDGRRFTSTNRPIFDAAGEVSKIAVFAAETTEQVQAEQALRIQRDLLVLLGSTQDLTAALSGLLHRLLRMAPLDCGGIYWVDEVTGNLDVLVHEGLSPEFVAAVGHFDRDSPQAKVLTIGKGVFLTRQDLEHAPYEAARDERLRSLAVLPVVYGGKLTGCLNLGSRTHDVIPQPVRSTLESIAGHIGGLFARHQAERERARLQDQLLQAQKMEAVGTLAGGIAHEMNNILTVIMGLGSLVDQMTPADDERTAFVKSILTAAERGGSLTKNLLGFSRKTEYAMQEVSLNQVVREQEQLLRRTVRAGISIDCRLADDLAAVRGDFHQLSQVIMNLCLNAVDAIHGDGRLTVTTSNDALSGADAAAMGCAWPHRCVRVDVSDTGCGMPPEVSTRIFEPFFTTKEPGKGTGLGMAVVYGVVKEHGGGVTLETAVGAGTTVTLRLPALGVPARDAPAAEAARVQSTARGTILYVDDEELLRHTARAMLEKLGFDVLVAENGRAAVELYRRRQSDIDLVLLDLAMPVMDGALCLEELRLLDPQVKVVISSGYLNDPRVMAAVGNGAAGYLAKPFDLQKLAEAVTAVLGAPADVRPT